MMFVRIFLALIYIGCSTFSLQAGRIYDIIEDYSEEKFRILAKEKVLSILNKKALPVPGTNDYQEQHQKIFIEEYEKALKKCKEKWINQSLETAEILVNQRLKILKPLLNQLHIAKTIACEANKSEIEKILNFINKKSEDLNYIIDGYIPEVLPNQARVDNSTTFVKSKSPFGTYARFLQEDSDLNAHNYAVKKFIIYKGMLDFLEKNHLIFASGTAKILNRLLLERLNEHFQARMNTIKEEILSEYYNETNIANKNFISSLEDISTSENLLEDFEDLYEEDQTIEYWLKTQTVKWLNRTDFHEEHIQNGISLQDWLGTKFKQEVVLSAKNSKLQWLEDMLKEFNPLIEQRIETQK